MQIQEINSKVNGVFVRMIKSFALFFMALLILAIKQVVSKEKKSIYHKLEQLS